MQTSYIGRRQKLQGALHSKYQPESQKLKIVG